MKKKNIEACLRGDQLYGDDFTQDEIEEWYRLEAEGYADLGTGSSTSSTHVYGYAALNRFHGFSRIRGRTFDHALGLGSAFGHEFKELAGRVKNLTILEPSEKLVSTDIAGIKPEYVKPSSSGDIPFESGTFDLITSFGTLHHIANVSHVVSELSRVAAPGGTLLLREPCVSLGDWRKPRKGLTWNERGIPPKIMFAMLKRCGWEVTYHSYCIFPLTGRLGKLIHGPAFNNMFLTRLDCLLATVFRFNKRYHALNFLQKLRPQSLFIIARRAGVSVRE